ncbi:MAG: hypothetical protein GY932_06360 [Arcobacter sp.]|nr:hypothetical protein [Arcobacter sp.]
MKVSVNSFCPCGSKKKYKKCCKIYHNGSNPSTALELMKSRYSAFIVGDYKYIIKTTHKENIDYTGDLKSWKESILDFSNNSEFKKLEIIDFTKEDKVSYVTFKAIILQNNKDISFIEKSKFYKVNNTWLYHSGEFLNE